MRSSTVPSSRTPASTSIASPSVRALVHLRHDGRPEGHRPYLRAHAAVPGFPTAFFGYRADDVPYTGLSLTHGNALVATLLPALSGAVDHSVFSRRFTRTRLWDACIEHGCTTWSNLGGIASAIYGESASPQDGSHQVRLVVSAGMPRELWVPFEERFGVGHRARTISQLRW
jgi:hypothetical protein